jgi:pyruvate-ferredoxin/flavodoxin oxidoreductase
MGERETVIIDGNEAAASVAHRLSEVIAIYPITPSSAMGELADEWSAAGQKNLWGDVPEVVEMQSEGGAAGAVHGALQAGALCTTFTASQGLLLMIPSLYKIAGELTPFCLHVSARTVATHALSIFGDHSDVMACRQTGLALLASGSVQEAHDLAAVAHAATLEARVPFLHFFDGFRTSHELCRIERLSDDDLRALLAEEKVAAFRARALSPDHPQVRGTAQNPDVFFQAREAQNPYYTKTPQLVQQAMDRLRERTGRAYRLFDYAGHPQAERVLVAMGSGAEVAHETVEWLCKRGHKVGLVKVRLYRPFDVAAFVQALPPTVQKLAVLDRTKEPGSVGEPLYTDVVAALQEGWTGPLPRVLGGRYGLSSKEFTPAMVVAVFDELSKEAPKRHFTVGIEDDVTGLSLAYDRALDIEEPEVIRSVFYGLGADGTVGANKNSIKIIGEEAGLFAQGYFVYDSKKSGAVTVSHLRFGPRPLRSSYLVRKASFVGCHQFGFLEKLDVLEAAAPGAVFLLNAPHPASEVWDRLPLEVQEQIVRKRIRLFVIDALAVAGKTGMKGRINTVMQTCFFAISGVLPREQAIAAIKHGVEKTYGKKGAAIVARNFEAIDQTLENLFEVPVPAAVTATHARPAVVPPQAPPFVQQVTAAMMAGKGDGLPVSALPVDGSFPSGTSRWEKRGIASELPVWDAALCIQCNKCALVCPHAALRVKVFDEAANGTAPATFKSVPYKGTEWKGQRYSLQVAPDDCTGCSLCHFACPAKDKANPSRRALAMEPVLGLREPERRNWDYFLALPEADRAQVRLDVKGSQFLQPLFEFSGACSGCGETPYLKLLTQLFGDRLLIANATGCSSIYGGNLPTTPYCKDASGRGPAWANSLFEDNAEFGLGMRLAVDKHEAQARELLARLAGQLPEGLAAELASAQQATEAQIANQRERVERLRAALQGLSAPEAKRLSALADSLVKKSVWIVGGDGWAYDIGYGGLDHVLALGRKVNVLVLDTEVYSNTGGQASKSTPLGASAKFAAGGKQRPKKDLGLLAMAYGDIYVARVALGAKDAQTLKALQEAESYPGPALVLAYSPCIAHGYELAHSLEQQRLAVETGYWPLYRYDPRRAQAGEAPFKLDSAPPKGDLAAFMHSETRFRMVEQQAPERYTQLLAAAKAGVKARFAQYEQLETPGAAPKA